MRYPLIQSYFLDVFDRFEQECATEAKVLSTLNHPCIPTLIKHTRDTLVTTLGPGLDLFELIDSFGPVSCPIARHIMRQLLGVISYLQQKCDLVHRDIKPENKKKIFFNNHEWPQATLVQYTQDILSIGASLQYTHCVSRCAWVTHTRIQTCHILQGLVA